MGKTKIKLKCNRCGYEWFYSGESKFFTSCPKCRNSNVNVHKHRVKKQKAETEPSTAVTQNQQPNK